MMKQVHNRLRVSYALMAVIITVFISCSNSNDPAEVDSGVTDTTNIFAPDTVPGVDTGATLHVRDTGMQR